IVTNSSPSIRYLATLRGSTLEAELALSEYLYQGGAGEAGVRIDSALKKLKSGVDGYLAVPAFPGEQPRRSEVHEAWVRFDESVTRTQKEANGNNDGEARQMFTDLVNARAKGLVDSALRAIEFNAQAGRTLAAHIRKTRQRTIRLSNVLAASCVLLGLA